MRRLAYEIVYKTMEEKGHSDELFHRILRAEPSLNGQQKRFLKRLSYGTIERSVEMDAILSKYSRVPVKKLTPSVRTVLRMALYELRYMDQIPEAVSCHEAVEQIRWAGEDRYSGFVNGVLRAVLRQEKPDELAVWEKLSLPKPLYDHLCEAYGKKTARRIGEAFLKNDGAVTLHVDTSKIAVGDFAEKLREAGIEAESGVYMPDALRVMHVEDITRLPGYESGWFYVQDESSMLPVLCAGIRPGDQVVDVCSAPGGKAMHVLLCLQGEGFLSARDVSEKKVARLRENIERIGYTNVECAVWDGTRPDPNWCERADVVLADVPCSGIGIIGRKPEIKYRAMESAGKLVPIQRSIAEASLAMLKPGGVLIYSTCTINAAENEENVRWLVEEKGMRLQSIDPYLPEKLRNRLSAAGMLQMLPGVQKSDGFFVARLQKPDSPEAEWRKT